MADNEFIKKIGLRKRNTEENDVEFGEENVSKESSGNNTDVTCEVESDIEDSENNVENIDNNKEIESNAEKVEGNNDETDSSGEIIEDQEELPTSIQVEDELIRVKYKIRYRKLLRNTLYSLLIVAAVSVLIATLFLPVLEIYGSSMNPTLENGDIVISIKTSNLKRGDICGLYYNNHLLVKRVIGLPGDSIEMDDAGNLFVNGEYVDEPYISEKILGECDLDFPYVVPEQSVFILGDNRPVAVDSRNEQFGCISYEEIQGKIIFRVWPIKSFGVID